jgi:hypothetical protein
LNYRNGQLVGKHVPEGTAKVTDGRSRSRNYYHVLHILQLPLVITPPNTVYSPAQAVFAPVF